MRVSGLLGLRLLLLRLLGLRLVVFSFLRLLLLLLLALLELFLTECQVVAGVVVGRSQAKCILVMLNRAAEQLLLHLGVRESLHLVNVSLVVVSHGTDGAVLLSLRYEVVKAVSIVCIALCQVGIGEVEGSPRVLRVLLQRLQVIGVSLVVLLGTKVGITLMDEFIFFRLRPTLRNREQRASHEEAK